MKATRIPLVTALIVTLLTTVNFVNGADNWKQKFSKCSKSLTDVKAELEQCRKEQGPPKKCPLGFTYNETFGSCYNFVTQEKMIWIHALAFCNAQGANLVAIESAEELKFIQEEIARRGIASPGSGIDSFHTGGTRINGPWQWIGGPSWPTKPMAFAPWYPNEGTDKDEHCHILWAPISHRWADYYCIDSATSTFNFICEIKIN